MLNINLDDLESKSDLELELEMQKLNLPDELKWENLTFTNDFIFGKIMRNITLCRELLQRVLPDIKIGRIVFPEVQKSSKDGFDELGVRFDFYVKSGDGTKIYNVEMQTVNKKNLPKRSRAYHISIGHEALNKYSVKKYDKMPTAFVIFICTFDLFKKGLHKYTFKNVCLEDKSLELGDGAVTIFLNAKGKQDDVSPELEHLLKFVAGKKVDDDPFIDKLDKELKFARKNSAWRRAYMMMSIREQSKIMEAEERAERRGKKLGKELGIAIGEERGIAIGEERGRRSGRLERTLEIAKKMLIDGVNLSQIIRFTGLSVDEINELQRA